MFLKLKILTKNIQFKIAKIYDANDKEFLIRGINSANADWGKTNSVIKE